MLRFLTCFLVCFLAVSSMNVASSAQVVNDADPYVEINKVSFYFNHMVFALYVRPAAAVFDVLPLPAKESVNNFIQNIRTVPYTINSLLQGKILQASENAVRFMVNTTFGVFGLFDVAVDLGLPEQKETLGDTFYAWGWKNSDYFVIPLIGPSTIRDVLGIAGDYFMAPSAYFPPEYWNPYYLTVLINTNYRAKHVHDLVSIAGVNDYDFVRSSFLQHRMFELTGEEVALEDAQGNNMLGEPPA